MCYKSFMLIQSKISEKWIENWESKMLPTLFEKQQSLLTSTFFCSTFHVTLCITFSVILLDFFTFFLFWMRNDYQTISTINIAISTMKLEVTPKKVDNFLLRSSFASSSSNLACWQVNLILGKHFFFWPKKGLLNPTF